MIFQKQSDEDLLASHRTGQAGAMDQLLERYQDRTYQFVLWKTGTNRTEAEDIAQDIFLQVFCSAASFDGRSKFRTWFYSLAGHVCSNWVRTKSRSRHYVSEGNSPEEVAVVLDFPDHRPNALEMIQGDERAQAVHLAVQNLDSQHRVVLLLLDWEELSYAEISKVLEIPEGTVKSRVHHARLKLARSLQSLNKG